MDASTRKKYLSIGKIVAANLIPIVGVIFLNWGIFELALTYLLETAVIFLVFFIDKYFIDKKSRYPFFFACIQLFFLMFPFGGLIFGWAILVFSSTEPAFAKSNHMIEAMTRRLYDFDFWWILLAFFLFEGINYVVKNIDNRNHKSSSVWFNLRKLLIVHLFVIISSTIYGALPHNMITGLFLIIAFKIILDYLLESEKFLNRFDGFLEKFSTAGLDKNGNAIKDPKEKKRR